MDRLKKIGLVLLLLGFTVGVGFLLYRFFLAGPPEPEVPPGTGVTPGEPGTGLPPAGEFVPGEPVPGEPGVGLVPSPPSAVASGGITLTQSVELFRSIAPTLSPTGGVSYYSEADGRFYTLDAQGNPVLLSSKVFPSVSDVTWSPGTDKAIVEFPDASKIIYDFESETQLTLPSHWEDFSFSSDGESFAAKSLGLDPDNRWLITVDANGSNSRLVEHLGGNADKVTVNVSPDNAVLALSETGDPVGFDTREILLIGPNNENFKALRVQGFNMTSIWSPSGNFLLYSSSSAEDDYRPTIWFVNAKGDAIGENRTKIGLRTWAEKCTFADELTVYCAVPDTLPVGVGLQPRLAEDPNEVGSDAIYRVDLRTGNTELIGRPDTDARISKVIVGKDQSTLFFQDLFSKEIRQMRLK